MRIIRLLAIVLVSPLLLLAVVSPTMAQETLLQNDGFVTGQSIFFQGGFGAGEMAGSRFLPTGVGPWRLNRVRFLFGGATTTRTITLHIYDDTAGTTTPGMPLFSADYSVTGSTTSWQEIDLTADDVQVPGQFRVAFEFQHAGAPSVARDGDGNIQATRNFIYSPPTWFQSSQFGLMGDWIIRAGVVDLGTPSDTTVPARALALRAAPNPFNPSTIIQFELPAAAHARLTVYRTDGRWVRRLADEDFVAGRHRVPWDGKDARGVSVSSGNYIAQLEAGDKTASFPMRLVR